MVLVYLKQLLITGAHEDLIASLMDLKSREMFSRMAGREIRTGMILSTDPYFLVISSSSLSARFLFRLW